MSENNEDKRSKFERLAEKRTNEALKKIRLIGNLSNKRNYDYDRKHVDLIINALEKEIKQLRTRFNEEKQESSDFSFRKNNKEE